MGFKDRLQIIEQQIEEAAQHSGRNRESIQLIAVSKGHPLDAIQEAAACGINLFGENRVQEAIGKMEAFAGSAGKVDWHLIGRVQKSKIRHLHDESDAIRFDLIHSIDRLSLAEALNNRMQKYGLTQPVLLQINVSGEHSKAGVPSAEAEEFLRQVSQLSALRVKGLMTIAPAVEDQEEVRPVFRQLNQLGAELAAMRMPRCKIDHLSMGMTNDFVVAIEEGATLIRIGRALFGERE